MNAMIYYRERQIISGDHKEIDITVQKAVSVPGCKRAARINRSSRAQEALNEKNARRKLIQTINANFNENDIFVTLTYENEVSEKEAERQLRNYIDRLRTAYRKEGEELRYIYVTEQGGNGRIHHHIIIAASERVKAETLRGKWRAGYSFTKRIYEQENGFEQLARYMMKNPKGKRRFNHSLNLKKPVELVNDERYTGADIYRFLQAVKAGRAAEHAERLYPGYVFTGIEVLYNELYPGLPNIYIKMRRKRQYTGRPPERTHRQVYQDIPIWQASP